MENSLWHKVSDKEVEQIRKDAKELLEKFQHKLEEIKTKEDHLIRESGTRDDGTGWKTDSGFQEIIFANAPFVEDNSIVAEKGGWK